MVACQVETKVVPTIAPSQSIIATASATAIVYSLDSKKPVTLALVQAAIVNIAMDETNIYIATCSISDSYIYSDGMILKVNKNGNSAPIKIFTHKNCIYSITVDETNIYWVINENSDKGYTSLMKANKNNYSYSVLASRQEVIRDLAVDKTDIYWTECKVNHDQASSIGAMIKMSKKGTEPIILVASDTSCFSSTVIDLKNIYWLNNEKIERMSKADGIVTTIVSIPKDGTTIMRLGIDETNIYWMEHFWDGKHANDCDHSSNVIKMAPKDDIRTQKKFISIHGSDSEISKNIRIDDSSLYLVSTCENALVKISKADGTYLRFGQGDGYTFFSEILVDRVNVYWTSYGRFRTGVGLISKGFLMGLAKQQK